MSKRVKLRELSDLDLIAYVSLNPSRRWQARHELADRMQYGLLGPSTRREERHALADLLRIIWGMKNAGYSN